MIELTQADFWGIIGMVCVTGGALHGIGWWVGYKFGQLHGVQMMLRRRKEELVALVQEEMDSRK